MSVSRSTGLRGSARAVRRESSVMDDQLNVPLEDAELLAEVRRRLELAAALPESFLAVPAAELLDRPCVSVVSTVELETSGAWCVAADFSVGMLAAGSARIHAEAMKVLAG